MSRPEIPTVIFIGQPNAGKSTLFNSIAGPKAETSNQLADEALYAAKERGRNRTVIMDREYETLTTGAFRIPRTRGQAA